MEESRIVSALFFLLVILVWYACRGTSLLLDTRKIHILKFIFLLLLKLQYSSYFQENQVYIVLLLSFFVL